jgi:hypothetical protein
MKLNLEKVVEMFLRERYDNYQNTKLDAWYEKWGVPMTSDDVRANILTFEEWLKDNGLAD